MPRDSNKQSIFIAVVLVAFLVGGTAGVLGGAILGPKFLQLQQQIVRDEPAARSEIIRVVEETGATWVAEQAAPAVVSVIVTKELERLRPRGQSFFNSPFEDFFGSRGFEFFFGQPDRLGDEPEIIERQVGAGSGFVVSETGLIITNRHVVDDEDADYTVVTNSGEEFEAQVLARDPILDLAVLQVNPSDYELHILELADSDELKIGQTVIAIGNALGQFSNTVTKGVVSGIGRTITAGSIGDASVIEEAIQTDAAINPGNSGGPLLDLQGRVIGVNTAVSNSGQSIGFAIPINEAKRIVRSVEEHGRIVRPFLGVRYQMLDERMAELNNIEVSYGALLVRGERRDELAVMPGSPADKAGLEENDIILEVEGVKIEQGKSLARVLAKYQPDDTIKLKVLHDGETREVDVTLDEFEE